MSETRMVPISEVREFTNVVHSQALLSEAKQERDPEFARAVQADATLQLERLNWLEARQPDAMLEMPAKPSYRSVGPALDKLDVPADPTSGQRERNHEKEDLAEKERLAKEAREQAIRDKHYVPPYQEPEDHDHEHDRGDDSGRSR